jgi:Acyl-protein synthetase, LuxE
MQAKLPNIESEWFTKIFSVTDESFEKLAIEIFQFQYMHNIVYKNFADALHINPATVTTLKQIPFLPVSFFKTHTVTTTVFEPQVIFESSGTSQTTSSKHFVKNIALYKQSFTKTFELLYGPVNQWCILALLPAYLERKNSSLVLMADELIKKSTDAESGFYLYNHAALINVLQKKQTENKKTLLLGVTFALLDMAENYQIDLRHVTIMETGGMKGRREELTRQQVHEILKHSFKVKKIHSEYGMTELLSQAYSKSEGLFITPPWLRILLREEDDPLKINMPASIVQRGGINIIDLANIYSCSFIATDDAGKLHANGNFEVLGRLDNSDIRGCSLMVL